MVVKKLKFVCQIRSGGIDEELMELITHSPFSYSNHMATKNLNYNFAVTLTFK